MRLLLAAAALAVTTPDLVDQQIILPAEGPYSVTVSNLRGRVVAKGWNKNVVYIHAVKRATHELAGEEADLFAKLKAVVKEPTKGEVVITTEAPGAGKFPSVQAQRLLHGVVDYELLIPPDCALNITQELGPIAVVGVGGNVKAFSRDGDVTLTDVSGWAEGTNERGALAFGNIHGDAVGKSFQGNLSFKGIEGDVRAASATGNIRVDVPTRWVGEVGYHTVSGAFRSDLVTYKTTLHPGDKGYRGVLRGPLAGHEQPLVRYTLDTTSGDATVASERAGAH
ncbi:MAG: hypothetical protein JWM80_1003 [Cyanobacteria bacterium RYN_339]|nr:hypothetical protein [Cyanobacteria bacterium RYN_339]